MEQGVDQIDAEADGDDQSEDRFGHDELRKTGLLRAASREVPPTLESRAEARVGDEGAEQNRRARQKDDVEH